MKMSLIKQLIALTFFALFFSNAVSALPTEEAIDRAADCLSDTIVNRFNANPGIVFPGSATTLNWQVTVPPGCGVSLYVRGIRVNRSGSMAVTPTFPVNSYALEGRMLGLRSILAHAPVTVNTDACRKLPLPATLLAPMIQDVLDAYDAGESEIQQTRDADITISSSGLAITMYFEVDKFGPNPSVRLSMRLKFNTVNGVVFPAFTYFHPQASTYLPDDWIESKIYAKQEGVLESFKTEINELLADPSFNLINSAVEKLFSIETIDQAVLTTVCPLPRRLETLPLFPAIFK
jgi:hypothetical protein